ncbi:MAG: FHA domain-containing protein [Ectothiorhodospiraceae bacterium]|jgi:pSer/pThr/pTyr-binding forkhead associated (FHA) protein
MKIVLRPVSRSDAGEIVINDDLFAVGRHEPPFAGLSDAAAAGLAERHARLFQQGGAAYVVDLGDGGETRVNGEPVRRRAVKVHDGDEVCFGDALSYRVSLEETPRPGEERPGGLSLTLVPVSGQSGLDPIAVERFPLLVGKDVGVFARYVAASAEEGRYLSRRHALIYQAHDTLYVEDLGSTNGTFLNDEPVGERPVPLVDGTTVSFGGDFFAYRADVGPAAPEPAGRDREPGTIFLSSADSFLDAFCPADEAEGQGEEADNGGAANDAPAAKAKAGAGSARVGLLGRVRVFASELRGALSDDARGAKRRRWVGVAVVAGVVLALGIPFGFYMAGGPEREVRQLMAESRYGDAVEVAADYLRTHPQAESMRLLATESLVRHVVPIWSKSLGQGQFDAAAQALAAVEGDGRQNPDARNALALMEWMTRLERFVAERGGIDAPLEMFRHEKRINRLVAWWEEDPRGHRNLLNRLMTYTAALKPTATRAMSHLVALQNEKSVHLAAIATLEKTVGERLAGGQSETLPGVFDQFDAKYPTIVGTDRLRSDLDNWTALKNAIGEHDLKTALRLARQTDFATPPFRDAAGRLNAELPSPEVAAAYERASQAWAAGQWNAAFETLRKLESGPWGEVATRRLKRYETVLSDYRSLMQARDSEEYGRRMLVFYAGLDPVEDARLRQALNDDYQRYRKQALEQADLEFKKASEGWRAYRDDGGIDGLLRLEDPVSDSYRHQAQRLSRAQDGIFAAAEIYRILALEPPVAVRELHETVQAEVKRQRQWLEDMHIVLEASLLQAKLALLPAPGEERQ